VHHLPGWVSRLDNRISSPRGHRKEKTAYGGKDASSIDMIAWRTLSFGQKKEIELGGGRKYRECRKKRLKKTEDAMKKH